MAPAFFPLGAVITAVLNSATRGHCHTLNYFLKARAAVHLPPTATQVGDLSYGELERKSHCAYALTLK